VRDVVATSPHHAGELVFYHPDMQEVLLRAAAVAGAEVVSFWEILGSSSWLPSAS
jgi:hypothetical protein